MTRERIYIDSCCWISILIGEPTIAPIWQSILESAQAKDIEIWTSTYTLVEVQGGRAALFSRTESELKKLNDYFENEYINLIQLGYYAATRARELVWHDRLSTSDAIHIASAEIEEIPTIYTTDEPLIKRSEKVIGGRKLPVIKSPDYRGQPKLGL